MNGQFVMTAALVFFLYKELTNLINQIELNMNVVLREKVAKMMTI